MQQPWSRFGVVENDAKRNNPLTLYHGRALYRTDARFLQSHAL